MKKHAYTHVGKVFSSPEMIICEIVRVIETENLSKRLADRTLFGMLSDSCDISERLCELDALLGTLCELDNSSLWNQDYMRLKLPALERLCHKYAAAFMEEAEATPRPGADLLTALSVWYWDQELHGSLLGIYHWVLTKGMTAAHILEEYKNDYFTS